MSSSFQISSPQLQSSFSLLTSKAIHLFICILATMDRLAKQSTRSKSLIQTHEPRSKCMHQPCHALVHLACVASVLFLCSCDIVVQVRQPQSGHWTFFPPSSLLLFFSFPSPIAYSTINRQPSIQHQLVGYTIKQPVKPRRKE